MTIYFHLRIIWVSETPLERLMDDYSDYSFQSAVEESMDDHLGQ
jgi:hypothetical protein